MATMESDYCLHVRKCHKCQTFADNVNALPLPLNVLAMPWPFSMWGIDVIGAIEPKAANEHRFILVAIDYFTKWVEAASYASVTRSVVVREASVTWNLTLEGEMQTMMEIMNMKKRVMIMQQVQAMKRFLQHM